MKKVQFLGLAPRLRVPMITGVVFLLVLVMSSEMSGAADTSGSPSPPPASSPTATPSATPNTAIRIPCMNDAGNVVNVSDPTSVCASALPKCTDLYNTWVSAVKSQLSWKIWGYYNGLDLDLSKTKPGSGNLVGKNMATQICSVVGQTVQVSGAVTDAELTNQMIAKKAPCGAVGATSGQLPSLNFKDNTQLSLGYQNGAGSLWVSYMQGAYPWFIRKNASDVLTTLKSDFSNINSVLTSTQQATPSMLTDLIAVATQQNSLIAGLSAAEKASCDTSTTDMTAKCLSGSVSLSDPAYRVCTLSKAQLASFQGTLPHILITEIMTRAQNQYQQMIGGANGLLSLNNYNFHSFINYCNNIMSDWNPNKTQSCLDSCAASCYFGGGFYTTDNGVPHPISSGGHCNKANIWVFNGSDCQVSVNFPVGASLILDGQDGNSSNLVSDGSSGPQITYNAGFAGFIEWVIRHNVCGQNARGDATVCDSIGIPSQPANATSPLPSPSSPPPPSPAPSRSPGKNAT